LPFSLDDLLHRIKHSQKYQQRILEYRHKFIHQRWIKTFDLLPMLLAAPRQPSVV